MSFYYIFFLLIHWGFIFNRFKIWGIITMWSVWAEQELMGRAWGLSGQEVSGSGRHQLCWCFCNHSQGVTGWGSDYRPVTTQFTAVKTSHLMSECGPRAFLPGLSVLILSQHSYSKQTCFIINTDRKSHSLQYGTFNTGFKYKFNV